MLLKNLRTSLPYIGKKMIEYIIDYYFKFKLPSMPFTEASFIVCAIIIFGDFRKKDEKRKILKFIIHYFSIFLPILLLKSILHSYSDFNLTYVYALVLPFYAFIAGRDKDKVNLIIYLLTYWTAYVYASSFAKSLGNIFCSNTGIAETDAVKYIFLCVVMPTVMIACTVMIKKFPLDDFPKLSFYIVLPFIVVCILANAAKILVDSVKEEGLPFFGTTEAENGLFIFFTGVLLYLLNVFCYAFSYSKAKSTKKDEEMKSTIDRIEEENEMHKNDAASVKENLEEMRSLRHDIKNQFAYMQMFLAQKDYGGLEKYLNEVSGGLSADAGFADVDNVTVRNVLSLEKYKAKQNGIGFEASVAVAQKVNIKDKDLTAVIINLIDNAIEAITDDKIASAVISVKIFQKRNYLYICVENPVKDASKKNKRKILSTTKEDKELHGRGTKIVSAIANKYNGVFNYSVSDEKFSAEVMIAEREG